MEVLIIVAIPLAAYAPVCVCLANLGEWKKLALRYRATATNVGRTVYFSSAQMGPVSYGMCLSLTVCDAGLGLSVMRVFMPIQIAHPPLFIPWTEFHNVIQREFLCFRFIEVYIGSPTIGSLQLPIWVLKYLGNGKSGHIDW